MTVEELFRKLSYGELSNLAVAVDGTGTLKRDQQNRVMHFINEGLMQLHTRFNLLETSKVLTMGSVDLNDALADEVIQVISILTAYGESLTFSTVKVPYTIYVHDRSLHVPAACVPSGTELQVNFQNRHPVLDPITVDADLAQEITLIDDLHEALTAYIASKMYSNINTPDAAAIGQNHRNRYEVVCNEASGRGLISSEILVAQKFESRGWV